MRSIELNKYYFENKIVQANWLQFINSFSSISKIGFMEVSPKLERVKEKDIEVDEENLNATHINDLVKESIGEYLDSIDLEEVKKYIQIELSTEDVIDFTIARYIKKTLFSLGDEIHTIIETKKDPLVASFLKSIRGKSISTELHANGYSNNLLEYYTDTIQVSYRENESVKKYIFDQLQIVKTVLNLLSTRTKYCDFNEEDNTLIDDLINDTMMNSENVDISILIDVLDKFKTIIKKYSKELLLEKKKVLVKNN